MIYDLIREPAKYSISCIKGDNTHTNHDCNLQRSMENERPWWREIMEIRFSVKLHSYLM